MPKLTEAEYDALEDEFTRNPPDVDPARSRRPVRMIVVDDFSADWLRIKAEAALISPTQVINEMVRERITAEVQTN
jgi:hypothetical protein